MSNPIVSFDEEAVKSELRELVRKTIEETIIEMYLAGVSTRRIEDVGEILWGAGVSAGTVSNLNDKAFKAVDEWRCRPLAREYPYVYIDGIHLKRSWGGSYENAAVMAAIGVNEDGYREVIGCAEGFTESSECWRDFLSWLKSRGLRGVRMFVGDKAAGMVGSIAEAFPDARYQRCTVHFYRNVLAKAEAVADDLESMRLKEAAKVVREGFAETLTYCEMPREHWRRIRTNNAIERLIAGVTVLIGLLERHRSRADNAHPFCQDEKTRLPAEMLRLDS